MKMEAVSFFETLVNYNGITVPSEDTTFHSHRCDSLSYNKNSDVCDLPNIFLTHCVTPCASLKRSF
jgi:hypothetical protein